MPVLKSKILSAPFILSAVLIILALISVCMICITGNKKGGTVNIYSDNTLLWSGDLSNINGELILTVINDPSDPLCPYITEGIVNDKACFNVIRITKEGVCIMDSDCASKQCIHEGLTDSPSRPLVCLPHKLLITVTGTSDGTDAITY